MATKKSARKKNTAALRGARTPRKATASHTQAAPPAKPPEALWERDSFASASLYEIEDRAVDAIMGRFTFGLSPRALMDLYLEWATGLAFSPGKRTQLVEKALRKNYRYWAYVGNCLVNPETTERCIEPLPQDRRFNGDAWARPPFNFMSQAFLLTQQWWHNATTGIKGLTPAQENAAQFCARQILDVYAPSNFPWTNPEVLAQTMANGGANFMRGARNFCEDLERTAAGRKPVGAEDFPVGEKVAVTPGKVVYRNALIELIQYEPTTDKVFAEPVLITPAWIMKYYILDLSPENSLVKYLVDRGHTVFMISWKNPTAEDRDFGMDDYMRLGPLSALDVVSEIVPDQKAHAVGYCLGGTLLSIAAASLARDDIDRFASLTFLATQVDFGEAGELMLFINEKELSYLENMMWEQGYLDTRQMAGAFQLLRSNDLFWSHIERDYLMGERRPMNDLMAWNADATRMPYKMHSQYLRRLFLKNDLAEGRYDAEGRNIRLSDIRTPIFAVGTQTDHVAPWRSAYKIHDLTRADVTFLLTSGGHNAGIVSPPDHPRRRHQVATTPSNGHVVDADSWLAETPEQQGSWWPVWADWLAERSGGQVSPPELGAAPDYAPLMEAPGSYVFQE